MLSMDTFVINTLTDWQLTDLVERFKGNMVPQYEATGFLEERLRNIRKRLRSTSRSRSTAQTTSPQTPDDAALARARIPAWNKHGRVSP
ncbi:hypothetical protein R3I94_008961 [Phoxinus phoxinus]|uniref:Uncharacterized protein n=1 Tax=Phoxinus phoxinus TaxID=58324 RepID=A0AAN9DSP1_9TELE